MMSLERPAERPVEVELAYLNREAEVLLASKTSLKFPQELIVTLSQLAKEAEALGASDGVRDVRSSIASAFADITLPAGKENACMVISEVRLALALLTPKSSEDGKPASRKRSRQRPAVRLDAYDAAE
jgi:hypothetical protein